jgi:hypothetical protein
MGQRSALTPSNQPITKNEEIVGKIVVTTLLNLSNGMLSANLRLEIMIFA